MEKTLIKNTVTDRIADTLFIPLFMKYKETKKQNSFFHDPYSSELVKRIDYDFQKYSKAVQSSVGVAIRALYIDEVAKDFIESNANPVIVHIGCGLDTRYQRLGEKITGKTLFYEMDLPEVISLRKKLIPESSNNPYLSTSMLETDWMDDLVRKYPESSFLFISEGVFMYFKREQVKSVLINISSRFQNSRILFDVVSGWMCRNCHRHETVKLTNAVFLFDCDDDKEMESWTDKLRLEVSKKFIDFNDWKNVGKIKYFLSRNIPVIRNSARILLYSVN